MSHGAIAIFTNSKQPLKSHHLFKAKKQFPIKQQFSPPEVARLFEKPGTPRVFFKPLPPPPPVSITDCAAVNNALSPIVPTELLELRGSC